MDVTRLKIREMRDMLDKRHVGRKCVLPDDKRVFIQRIIRRRRNHLRKILGDCVGVALHGFAVMVNHLLLHHRVEQQRQQKRKDDKHNRKQAGQPCDQPMT